MQVHITAVGPDNCGLADPIVHYVTGQGANIAEIQMYDHDEERVFAMLLRLELAADRLPALREAMQEIGSRTGLSIRVWSPEERAAGRGWQSARHYGTSRRWLCCVPCAMDGSRLTRRSCSATGRTAAR